MLIVYLPYVIGVLLTASRAHTVAINERQAGLIARADLLKLDGSIGGDDDSCTKTQQCTSGCCRLHSDGVTGTCGLGPDFCGATVCHSTCHEKGDCDPGWGPGWSTAEECPLKVCCSKYGHCGTAPDYCGAQQVPRPSCSGNSTAKRTVGYYEGAYVPKFVLLIYEELQLTDEAVRPDQIHLGAYTHLNLAFEYIDPNTFTIADMDGTVSTQYIPFSTLKSRQPDLQLWMSVGGWTFNDPGSTAQTFSKLASSDSAQRTFFASVLSFMGRYNLDGIDIDWEYPVASERSGAPEDYNNYVSFLKNMRAAFDNSGAGKRYGISITIPSSYWYLQHFDIVNLDPIVDWFNMMTYDLHGTWDGPQDKIGSIALAHTNLTEITQSFDLLWRNGIDPSKVNMGLGFYGRSFTLADSGCKAAGCPFTAGGNPGPCTGTSGILSYTEIDDIIKSGATVTLDPVAAVELVTWDNNQWVSYDDEKTFKMKIDYANSLCIGGTLIWAVDLDVNGNAIGALGKSGQIPLKQTFNATALPDGPDMTEPDPTGSAS